MKIDLHLPHDLDPTSLAGAERAAKEAAVLELYRCRSVSAGRASMLLGMPLRTFLQLASDRGIPVLDMEPGELERDERNALGACPPSP